MIFAPIRTAAGYAIRCSTDGLHWYRLVLPELDREHAERLLEALRAWGGRFSLRWAHDPTAAIDSRKTPRKAASGMVSHHAS